MEEIKTIPPEVAALIPKMQLEATEENTIEFSDCIARLQSQLKKCPKIMGTDSMKEHPVFQKTVLMMRANHQGICLS